MTLTDSSPSPAAVRPNPAKRTPAGKRLSIVGILVGIGVALGYGVSKVFPPNATPDPQSRIEQLSELVESGERTVLVGHSDDSQVQASLGTYYEEQRRDEVFQKAFANRFGFATDEYTVLLLTLAHGTPPAPEDNGDEAPEDNEDTDTPTPLELGRERLRLVLGADAEPVESVALDELLPSGQAQASLILAAYAGTGELAWGKLARRYAVFPGKVSLEAVQSAHLRLADGREIELAPTSEQYPVPPGLASTDESP